MTEVHQLRIESQNGTVVNDYRLHDGKLQFRPINTDGSLLPGEGSSWRDLAAEDIAKHTALQTVVAEWLAIRAVEK